MKVSHQPSVGSRPHGPDFIAIGLPHSGTGWLRQQLLGRPDVWLPPIQELNVLQCSGGGLGTALGTLPTLLRKAPQGDPSERWARLAFLASYASLGFHQGDLGWYRGLFRFKGERLGGEISTGFAAMGVEQIQAVAAALPETRFLILLRDPVERLWSVLCRQVQLKQLEIGQLRDRDALDSLLDQPEWQSLLLPTPPWLHWTTSLPAERLRHWFFDDIVQRPAEVRDEIGAYLGLRPGACLAPPAPTLHTARLRIPIPERVQPLLVSRMRPVLTATAAQFGGAAQVWWDHWLSEQEGGLASSLPAAARPPHASVSVILPVLNQAAHLPISLPALLAQEALEPWDEVVVVDNGSTDGSEAIARAYPTVRVLREAKRGSYAARNCGIRASSGEVVIFLDPDCRPRAGWLAAALAALEDPDTELVMGPRFYAPRRHLRWLQGYENGKIQWLLREGRGEKLFGYTNNMAVRRSLLERLGLFEELARGADTIYVQRVVHSLGIAAIRFMPGMGVDHLEIVGLTDYLAKRATYGASNAAIAADSSFRSLDHAERLAIFRETIGRESLRPWEVLGLAGLLVLASAFYDGARWLRQRG